MRRIFCADSHSSPRKVAPQGELDDAEADSKGVEPGTVVAADPAIGDNGMYRNGFHPQPQEGRLEQRFHLRFVGIAAKTKGTDERHRVETISALGVREIQSGEEGERRR